GNRPRGNDANHKRHVRARLLDVVGKRAVIVIDSVTMVGAINMRVSDSVAVGPARVMEGKVEVVVAGVSSCGFRCGNKDTLKRKSERRRHHDDDSNLSEKGSPREVQRSGPQSALSLLYVAGIRRTRGARHAVLSHRQYRKFAAQT